MIPKPENLPFLTEAHSGHERWPVCRVRFPKEGGRRLNAGPVRGKHTDAAFFHILGAVSACRAVLPIPKGRKGEKKK